jgi:hypothetical protein
MTDVCMLRSNVGDFLQGVVCREAVGEGCSDFGIFTCSLFIVEHRELVACYHLTHDLCNRLPREGEVRNKERNRKRRGGMYVCCCPQVTHLCRLWLLSAQRHQTSHLETWPETALRRYQMNNKRMIRDK